MCKILIFGGTTEGRILAEYCGSHGISALSSVTTEMAAELLPKSAAVTIGRLDQAQMRELIGRGFSLVIDATHPYAVEATANIKAACAAANVHYCRVIREDDVPDLGEVVPDIETLIERLNAVSGVILSTLGSKEASALTAVRDHQNRVWLRVLPNAENIEHCVRLGFDRSKIIAEKGPFSFEQNVEQIKRSGSDILITKNSGAAGGYPEKAAAAKSCGITLITLGRPHEEGISLEEIKALINKEFNNE